MGSQLQKIRNHSPHMGLCNAQPSTTNSASSWGSYNSIAWNKTSDQPKRTSSMQQPQPQLQQQQAHLQPNQQSQQPFSQQAVVVGGQQGVQLVPLAAPPHPRAQVAAKKPSMQKQKRNVHFCFSEDHLRKSAMGVPVNAQIPTRFA